MADFLAQGAGKVENTRGFRKKLGKFMVTVLPLSIEVDGLQAITRSGSC